jgi:hypothetical protein
MLEKDQIALFDPASHCRPPSPEQLEQWRVYRQERRYRRMAQVRVTFPVIGRLRIGRWPRRSARCGAPG